MTGAELRAHRKAAGLSQVQLARLAGFSRDAVTYWEAKAEVDARWGAPRRFSDVLGSVVFPPTNARARSGGLINLLPNYCQAQAAADVARLRHRQSSRRVICGAKTRKGEACRFKSEPGKTRCKFHGGKSTGPKTLEGKARIAEAQRRRWAKLQETR